MSNGNAPKPKSKWNVNNNNISLSENNKDLIAFLTQEVTFYKILLPEYGNHEEELEGKVNSFVESITAFSNTIQGYTQNAPNNSFIEKVKSSYQTISDFKDTYNELNTDISSYSNNLKAIVDEQITNQGVNAIALIEAIELKNKGNKLAVNPQKSINTLKTSIQSEYDKTKTLSKSMAQQMQAQLGPLFPTLDKLIEQYKSLNDSYKVLYTNLQKWTEIHQQLEANIISLIKAYYDIDNKGISDLLKEITDLLGTRNESKINEIFQKLIEIKEKLVVARSHYDAYYVSNQAITNLKHKAFTNSFNNGVELLQTLNTFEESINTAVGSFKEIVEPKRERLIQTATELYNALIEKIKGCLTSAEVIKNQNNAVTQQNELLALLKRLETQEWTNASQYSQGNKNKISTTPFNNKLRENVNKLSNNIKKKLNIKNRSVENIGNVKTIAPSMTGNEQNKWTNNGSRYLGNFYNKPVSNSSRVKVNQNSRTKYGPYYTKVMGDKVNKVGNPMVGRTLPMPQ